MKPNIAVIGAGISGVSTAYNIQNTLPEAQVTIISEQFSPNTTSDVAAGFLFPYLLNDTPEELQRRWSRATMNYVKKLFNSSEASAAGVQRISGYFLYSTEEKMRELNTDAFEGVRTLTRDELEMWPGYRSGIYCTSYMCEGSIYLPWLFNKLKQTCGNVIKRKLKNMEELFDTYDLVVNCAGIGAAQLLKDTSLTPVKGQVFRVQAPWLKHFHIFDGGHLHVFPGVNSVVVGGTHEHGNWDLKPNKEESQRIWYQICRYIPSLKNATIVNETSGLRPSRTKVRLEMELVHHSNRVIPVIHNYGHGGAGITLHWGCATEAADLVKHALQSVSLTSSKL